MISINTNYFLLPTIVVHATMTGIHCARIISTKTTWVTGKHVRNAVKTLKQRCTFTMAPMTIILKNFPIRPSLSQPVAPSANALSHFPRMAISLNQVENTFAWIARMLNFNEKRHQHARPPKVLEAVWAGITDTFAAPRSTCPDKPGLQR